ncbi:hypothetical protein [Sphingobacterium suaedae]|uniref:FAD-dependent oxidoreductase n=1 Tax=Sphingobacterium suaedae TaxID=1686402 RepID=A0ABW5KJK0_9SPHI
MKHIFYSVLILLALIAQPSWAQKSKKPQVLIYGSGVLAFAAAIQSAKSSVPTIWVTDTAMWVPEFSEKARQLEGISHTDGGIWLGILMDMALSKTRSDSLAVVVKRDMNPRLFQNALEKTVSKQPELTVIKDQRIIGLKKHKRDWQITLSNKQKYEVRTILDASVPQSLLELIAAETHQAESRSLPLLHDLTLAQVRTVVASGEIEGKLYAVLLDNLLAGEQDGFFSLTAIHQMQGIGVVETAPFRGAIGQALGATAAYLAFFKTSADKVDVRKLQMELLSYGARLLPYQDIDISDAHFEVVQKFGVTGMLPAPNRSEAVYKLGKDLPVSYRDVQPIFDQLYARSQLWFLDHKGEDFRWKDFISLIKFVGLRGDEVEKQIVKDWKTKLKFEGSFDPEGVVKRYEFAVILDRYAAAFVKAVNQQGQFIR